MLIFFFSTFSGAYFRVVLIFERCLLSFWGISITKIWKNPLEFTTHLHEKPDHFEENSDEIVVIDV